ncbi:hypothetical protein L227DRAFT_578097 [Lentinus tigrinus ALCF2SS1-6]|uniref:DUF6533 domain-containing protein n=1 Tax=Lentinus tigrinus ALCF2SS1-6 TaxID=1328759 RepID=A0A5C2S188_9APHY|nr:hypothetical protein L227DRAFT_578097 [Lentinus tigrinus ALCF2SS1-6]
MSSATANSALIAQYSSFLLDNYCAVAGTVLFIYECLITFGDEVALFWARRFTGAALLFVSNRALVMWAHVFTMITTYMPISQQRCANSARASRVFVILQYVPWTAFSTLRAFALTRLWSLSLFVLLLSSAPIGINFTNFGFASGGEVVPPAGCVYSDSLPHDLAKKFVLTIASRTCLISSDALLVLVTWWKLSRGSVAHRRKGSFVYVLLRDGTMYFMALLALNALHLTLTLLSHVQALQSVSVVTLFTEPLTGILVGRFLLNLQSANQKALDMEPSLDLKSDSGATSESLVFERVAPGLCCTVRRTGATLSKERLQEVLFVLRAMSDDVSRRGKTNYVA